MQLNLPKRQTKLVFAKIARLYELYLRGDIKGPKKHEVHPNLPIGSRENYLYFTLPCCVNFQRSSPALWRSALKTFEDPATNYVFFPERIREKAEDQIRNDLIRYRLALQINRHPTIWLQICKTLEGAYESDPRNILEEGGYDVKKILEILWKKRYLFPYLGGVKLSNYWLFILSRFTDAKLKNVEEISIIPDTHVIKSTIKLGLAQEGVKAVEVAKIWRDILAEVGISPRDMHAVLWRWSRNGFRPELG